MARPDLPGSFEQLVLLALVRLGDRAYGMTVRQEIERRTKHDVSLGAVYATLDRLEEKGWVASHEGPGGEERGGRARRFFKIQSTGSKALVESLRAIDEMRDQLPNLGPAQEL
jgi:DNA-binding PadR family transcriptional regulator